MGSAGESLRNLLPAHATYRALSEVARITGQSVQPSSMADEPITVYSLPSFDAGREPERLTRQEVGSAKSAIESRCILVAKLNPHIPRVWRLDSVAENSYCSPEFYQIEPLGSELDLNYLYYFILTKMKMLSGSVTGSTNSHKRLHREDFLSLRIPLPSLEVQREVTEILDTFVALASELEAELEARHYQYTHFRDALMTYGRDVPRVPMGELFTIVRGASPRPIQAFLTDADDGIPWIKIGDVASGEKYITSTSQRVTPAGAAKSRRIHPGDFVLSNSMSFGRPYVSKIEGCIHDGWLSISDFSADFNPDFLYHLLRSDAIQTEFIRRAGAGTVKNLNADIVKAVSLPVPAMDEQARVVAILDRFDLLVNDSSIGLPAELAARRKQYEHYRDKLFTFEETA